MKLNSKIQRSFLVTAITVMPFSAFALNMDGTGPNASSVVALYLFDENGGMTAADSRPSPLNLTLSTSQTGDVRLFGGFIEFGTGNAAARSPIPAAGSPNKITSQCRSSNEVTVEAYIESNTSNDSALAAYGPAHIVSLSNGVKGDANPVRSSGFVFGQGYDAGDFYTLGLNTSQTIQNNQLTRSGDNVDTDTGNVSIVRQNRIQQVFFIKNRNGQVRLYVSDENGIPILREQLTVNANFSNWPDNYRLSLGNAPLFDNDAGEDLLTSLGLPADAGVRKIEDKDWRGKIHMLAIYCTALTEGQVLGARAPTNWLEQTAPVDVSLVITPARQLARTIYARVAGAQIAIDHPILTAMEAALNGPGGMNEAANRMAAARIASDQPGFYNRTVKDFAKRMSNREHLVDVPLNDFSASIIGAARDDMDIRNLLSEDFYYRADYARAAVPSNTINDLITSNNHYESLELQNYDLKNVLVKVPGQVLYNGIDTTVPAANYDAAGILTSRAFLAAHAVAGTNRRLIEFTFSEFLCRPISQWADNQAPDAFVGRDVDRAPTGDHTKYQTTCRGCHGQMDGLRPAFARFTFETGFVKHAWVVAPDAETDPNEANNNATMGTMVQVPRGIAGKINRTNTTDPTFTDIILINNSAWQNFATRGINLQYFGWKPETIVNGAITGRGTKQFGEMITGSAAFPKCMAQRAFRAVCKREVESFDAAMIQRVTDSLKTTDNYKLRSLFERIAVQPECLGQ